jgi:anti-sigma B factor antagonist
MPNDPLTFEVLPGRSSETRIMVLRGPLTLANLFDFQKTLMAGEEKITILDLNQSEYMDSAGLGAILNYHVAARRRGRQIRLTGVNYRIAALFELTNTHTLLKTYESVEAAEADA